MTPALIEGAALEPFATLVALTLATLGTATGIRGAKNDGPEEEDEKEEEEVLIPYISLLD